MLRSIMTYAYATGGLPRRPTSPTYLPLQWRGSTPTLQERKKNQVIICHYSTYSSIKQLLRIYPVIHMRRHQHKDATAPFLLSWKGQGPPAAATQAGKRYCIALLRMQPEGRPHWNVQRRYELPGSGIGCSREVILGFAFRLTLLQSRRVSLYLWNYA